MLIYNILESEKEVIFMSLGMNIKKKRLERNMSQQELANALGYRTRSTIAKIESGENDVSQKKLIKFAAALGTTVDALLSGDHADTAVPAAPMPEGVKRNKNVVIILAGGESSGNRQNIPNQFVSVHNKPIVVYCMEAYQLHPAIDDIVVVCSKGWEDMIRAYANRFEISKLRRVVTGGESGVISLKNGVDALVRDSYKPEDIVIIQEATRPMINAETISKLLLAAMQNGSATICHSMDDYVQFDVSCTRPKYLNRSSIIALQSPEAHRMRLLTEVFLRCRQQRHPLTYSCFTMLLHDLGYNIYFIEGGINNIKIASDDDIAFFEALFKFPRGYTEP